MDKDGDVLMNKFKWVCEGCLVQPSCSELCQPYINQVRIVFKMVLKDSKNKTIRLFKKADPDAYKVMVTVKKNRTVLMLKTKQRETQCSLNCRGDKVG